ncbi:uncharacterized protein LOC109848840 isoform X2 [Asparagus officinalis]|uniref:uncharacterized protein LOC109848840 isoform X2 n=1 Tax=Asparagus officinalis TaxID=4686 RepID=UPI00098E11C0|nr:uncharacterized protein LOC109848840 isoform X2 [Asparagus officinalis]
MGEMCSTLLKKEKKKKEEYTSLWRSKRPRTSDYRILNASIMSELLGSGRESKKLVQMYSPFVVFAILATLRGLFPPRYCSISASNAPPPAQKKRV